MVGSLCRLDAVQSGVRACSGSLIQHILERDAAPIRAARYYGRHVLWLPGLLAGAMNDPIYVP